MTRMIAEFDHYEAILSNCRKSRRPSVSLGQALLETPILWPNKLIAIPVNYHAHAIEMWNVQCRVYPRPSCWLRLRHAYQEQNGGFIVRSCRAGQHQGRHHRHLPGPLAHNRVESARTG
jgi:hypothetical protein